MTEDEKFARGVRSAAEGMRKLSEDPRWDRMDGNPGDDEMTKKTATFIKDLDDFTGTAKLYRCDPPMETEPWDDEEEPERFEFIVASAAVAFGTGPETYLFGANEDGEVVAWGELPGSYRGGLDHERAIENAGYEVVADD